MRIILLIILLLFSARVEAKPRITGGHNPPVPVKRTISDLLRCRYPPGKTLCLNVWEGRGRRG